MLQAGSLVAAKAMQTRDINKMPRIGTTRHHHGIPDGPDGHFGSILRSGEQHASRFAQSYRGGQGGAPKDLEAYLL